MSRTRPTSADQLDLLATWTSEGVADLLDGGPIPTVEAKAPAGVDKSVPCPRTVPAHTTGSVADNVSELFGDSPIVPYSQVSQGAQGVYREICSEGSDVGVGETGGAGGASRARAREDECSGTDGTLGHSLLSSINPAGSAEGLVSQGERVSLGHWDTSAARPAPSTEIAALSHARVVQSGETEPAPPNALGLPAAHIEYLTLPAVELARRPEPVTLVLALSGARNGVLWTSCRERYRVAFASQQAAFSPLELEALAAAYDARRLWPTSLLDFVQKKLRDPSWRLTPAAAFDGVQPRRVRRAVVWADEGHGVPGHWTSDGPTLGQLARYFDARLERVELDDPNPTRLQGAA